MHPSEGFRQLQFAAMIAVQVAEQYYHKLSCVDIEVHNDTAFVDLGDDGILILDTPILRALAIADPLLSFYVLGAAHADEVWIRFSYSNVCAPLLNLVIALRRDYETVQRRTTFIGVYDYRIQNLKVT